MARINALQASALVAAVAAFAGSANAAITTLADGNSVSIIDTQSQAGMFNWTVDGVNHLNKQWFWFRIGAAAEQSIDSLPLINEQAVDTNPFDDPAVDTLVAVHAGMGLEFETTYVLRGGTALSGTSDITEQIKIKNTSATVLAVSFFQYADFDLNGTAGDDSVQFTALNRVVQADGMVFTNETIVNPVATFFEAGVFPNTLNKLNDANPDNLNNNLGVVGPADLTWAIQWDFVILPGQSVVIAKDKQIVPTPGALALVGAAGLFGLRRRRA